MCVGALMGAQISAQDLDQVRNMAILGQHAKAKEAVDKFLAVEKNAKKADGWFYKGFVYNMVSRDTTKTLDESAALKEEALAALKKYRDMDAKRELLEENSNSPFFDIYSGYASDLGIRAYNEKSFAKAADFFGKALEVHDFIYTNNITGANGFKFGALDTTLVIYSAIAASEAKNPDLAAVYYKKLVDANVGGDQYVDVYQKLADYYKDKKNREALMALLEKAKVVYPANNEYWVALEVEYETEGVEKPALFSKYDALVTKYPGNYTVCYNYAVELYHYIYAEENKTKDNSAYKAKIQDVIKAALAAKSTSEANFLMANFLYNYSIDISDDAKKLKGPKPEDLKKKKELNAKSDEIMMSAVPYAEKVVSLFADIKKPKSSEKINNRQALIILSNIYEAKKDQAKSDYYNKLSKEAY